MRRLLPLLCLALLAAGLPATAADLTEKQALGKAVAILKGDPYGDTTARVLANITERKLGPRSATVCGGGASPVWAFHVVVPRADDDGGPIDGWLVIDAAAGRLVCANLPFLD